MDTPKWVERLNAAPTPDEVLRIVNEYVESHDPALLTRLPVECQITPMSTAEDVVNCAYRLVAYHGHEDVSRLVHKFAAILTRASIRLAELAQQRPPEASSSGDDPHASRP